MKRLSPVFLAMLCALAPYLGGRALVSFGESYETCVVESSQLLAMGDGW